MSSLAQPKPRLPAAHWALALYAAAVYIFLYAPIAILILFSFNGARQTAVWQGFTLQWYDTLFHDVAIGQAVENSLIVAVLATVLACLIGTPAGLALAKYRFQGEVMTRGLLYLPLVIPEIVFGAALVTLFGVLEMRLGLWSVVVAHVVFSVSYVAIVIRARLAGMDPALEEAGTDLGAAPWQVFLRVTFPLLVPGIVASALLVFTLSLDDYLITSFVAGVGATTLPLRIYSMLKTGVTPEINAVSTLLLVVTVVLVLTAQLLLRGSAGKEAA